MNLQDFRRLEKELGQPPTQAEVREYQARPMLKAASVKFADDDIVEYFKDKWFNLGSLNDDMQKCIECKVTKSTIGLN